jgi:hypothetical protein
MSDTDKLTSEDINRLDPQQLAECRQYNAFLDKHFDRFMEDLKNIDNKINIRDRIKNMNQEELDKEIESLVDLIMEYKRQSDGEDILLEYRELFLQASALADEELAKEEEQKRLEEEKRQEEVKLLLQQRELEEQKQIEEFKKMAEAAMLAKKAKDEEKAKAKKPRATKKKEENITLVVNEEQLPEPPAPAKKPRASKKVAQISEEQPKPKRTYKKKNQVVSTDTN